MDTVIFVLICFQGICFGKALYKWKSYGKLWDMQLACERSLQSVLRKQKRSTNGHEWYWLFFSDHVFCLSISPSLCLIVCLSVCLPVIACLSANLINFLPVSCWLFFCLPVFHNLSVWLSVGLCLFLCLSTCHSLSFCLTPRRFLSVYLSVCFFVCLPVIVELTVSLSVGLCQLSVCRSIWRPLTMSLIWKKEAWFQLTISIIVKFFDRMSGFSEAPSVFLFLSIQNSVRLRENFFEELYGKRQNWLRVCS